MMIGLAPPLRIDDREKERMDHWPKDMALTKSQKIVAVLSQNSNGLTMAKKCVFPNCAFRNVPDAFAVCVPSA